MVSTFILEYLMLVWMMRACSPTLCLNKRILLMDHSISPLLPSVSQYQYESSFISFRLAVLWYSQEKRILFVRRKHVVFSQLSRLIFFYLTDDILSLQMKRVWPYSIHVSGSERIAHTGLATTLLYAYMLPTVLACK